MSEPTDEVEIADNWADDLWERPPPDPERLAGDRRLDPDEASHDESETAHLAQLTPEMGESGLWERPPPDPERLARYRLHDPDESSHYVRRTAHLPQLTPEMGESGSLWMRLLRRASVGH